MTTKQFYPLLIVVDVAAAAASLGQAVIAFSQHQYGFALSFLGAFGAWTILAAKEYKGQ